MIEQPGKSRWLQGFGPAQLLLAGHSRTALRVGLGATPEGSEVCWEGAGMDPKIFLQSCSRTAMEIKRVSEVFLKTEGCL